MPFKRRRSRLRKGTSNWRLAVCEIGRAKDGRSDLRQRVRRASGCARRRRKYESTSRAACSITAACAFLGLLQEATATRLDITRPRLNDLMRGKLSKFLLDALVNVTAAAGLVLHIRIADAA